MARKRESIEFTNTNKVYWPKDGYTKGDMLRYFVRIAPTLLPHLKDRPVVLKRFPNGIKGESFFQKNVEGELPKGVRTINIHSSRTDKDVHYIVCDSIESLLYMANLGTIEMHPWGSRTSKLHYPDFMIFDIDPGDKTTFNDVIRATRIVKRLLDSVKLRCYVKTSGKRGLHIYVPVGARYTYEKVRDFAHQVARIAERTHPELVSLAKHPRDRRDKIFVDYLRNGFGQTAVAVYCLRAVKGATVSTPLEWKEVRRGLDPKKFTIDTIFKRLNRYGDLWKNILRRTSDLERAARRLETLPQ